MDPTNPEVLFASSWERVRGPYFLKERGPRQRSVEDERRRQDMDRSESRRLPGNDERPHRPRHRGPSDAKVCVRPVEADTGAQSEGRQG